MHVAAVVNHGCGRVSSYSSFSLVRPTVVESAL